MSVDVREFVAKQVAPTLPVDVEHHELWRLAKAARETPGKPGGIHVATVWRWAKHGVRGRILPTVFIGGVLYTSRESYFHFLANSNCTGAPQVTSKRRERQIDAAEAELEAMGVR